MAGYIRINPDQMRVTAVKMRSQAERLSEAMANMDKIQSMLQSEWEGAASDVFAARYHETKPEFLKMEENIRKLAERLDKYVRLIEELDASLA